MKAEINNLQQELDSRDIVDDVYVEELNKKKKELKELKRNKYNSSFREFTPSVGVSRRLRRKFK